MTLPLQDFVPKKTSCLYSVDFEENFFEHKPVLVTTDDGQAIHLKRKQIKGSIPTKDTLEIVVKNSLTVSFISYSLHEVVITTD